MPPELTNEDADLLFAYMDGTLADAERNTLEARLGQDEFLRRELAALRRTVEMVSALPTLKAPRSFALSPDMVVAKPQPVEVLQTPLQPAAIVAPVAAPALKVVPRSRPRRTMWQPFAAAAAAMVLAFGLFAAVMSNGSTAPTASNIAILTTPSEPPFQNMVVGATLVDTSTDQQSEAVMLEQQATAAKQLTPDAPNAPVEESPIAELLRTESTQTGVFDGVTQQFSQGGMGGGGDQTNSATSLVGSANINPNATSGFLAITVTPLGDMALLNAPSPDPVSQDTPADGETVILEMQAPAGTIMPQSFQPSPVVASASDMAEDAADMTGLMTTAESTGVVNETGVFFAQPRWIRLAFTLLNMVVQQSPFAP